jgi:hypothetical protein
MSIPSKNIRAERIIGTLDASEFNVTGSLVVTGSITSTEGITGSLFGTASFASTASYVNPLTQSVIISGSVTSSQDILVNNITIGRGKNNQEYNTAVGYLALSSIDESINGGFGERNTAVGWSAFINLITGVGNVGIGMQAGFSTTIGNNNIFVGRSSGDGNTSGNNNVYVGNIAGGGSQNGNENTFVGSGAGYSATDTPGSSSYFGYLAGHATTGGDNVFIGYRAGFLSTKSNWFILGNRNRTGLIEGNFSTGNVLIGTSTDSGFRLDVSGSARITNGLTVTGSSAFNQNITVNDLIFGSNNTQGQNIVIGQTGTNSLTSITTGFGNVALGRYTATELTTGDTNIFIGDDAGQGAIGSAGNIVIGRSAGQYNFSNTTRNNYGNVFIGDAAGRDAMDTDENVALGAGALRSARGIFSTGNTTVGTYALDSVISSSYNVAIGYESGRDVRSGSFNILIGNREKGFRTGSFNTIIGSYISPNTLTGNVTKSVILADGSGSIRLYSPASTNVLIGTLTDTGEKFQVSGSAKITNGLTVTGSIRSTNGSEITTLSSAGITFNRFYSYIVPDINNSRDLFFGDVTRGVQDWAGVTFNATNFTTNATTISFITNSANRLRINSAGDIGIGTTSPTFKLDVSGSGRFSGNLTITGSATNSLLVRGSGTTSATNTVNIQNNSSVNLLTITDNGQTTFNTPSQTLASGQAGITVSQSITTTNTPGAQAYGVNIVPIFTANTGSLTQAALRVVPTFTGSFATSSLNSNLIAQFGTTGIGTQLSITDTTSGSIYQVNDISGLPILEATSDWSVRMYNFPNTVFEKTGSQVNIFGTLNATGSFILPLSQSTTPITGSAYWSGSLLFIYDGTRYRSSSFA